MLLWIVKFLGVGAIKDMGSKLQIRRKERPCA
jgi:hypothetical protein